MNESLMDYRIGMEAKHREWFKRYGATHQALGWGSSFGQARRFAAAVECFDLRRKGVLDVGCGFGDLLPYCAMRGANKYVGIDLLPEFIEEAKKKYRLFASLSLRSRVRFEVDDVFLWTEKADIVFALGVAWLENGKGYLEALVRRCLELANEGVVISVSSVLTPGIKEGFNLMSGAELASLAESVCEKWVLRRNYWGTDIMLVLYKRGWQCYEKDQNRQERTDTAESAKNESAR